MVEKTQPTRRPSWLSVVDSGSSGGYKSGRNLQRDTPEARSTCNTRSAGTPLRSSQLATAPGDLRPSIRDNAACPPTASHAANNAVLLMRRITTQSGDYVNTDSGERRAKNKRMRRSQVPASAFWSRLEEAIGRFYPDGFNANALANRLGVNQNAVYRWYVGPGLPELHRIADFARQGGVCIDWLVNGVKPKHPISKDPALHELFELVEQLAQDGEGRKQVLRSARNEVLVQREMQRMESERLKRRTGTD